MGWINMNEGVGLVHVMQVLAPECVETTTRFGCSSCEHHKILESIHGAVLRRGLAFSRWI